MDQNYPAWAPKGRSLQKWLKSPNEPGCLIPKTTLSMADLTEETYTIFHKPDCLDRPQSRWCARLGLPFELRIKDENSVYQYVSLLSNGFAKTMWIGRIGPGVLIIECIERTSESITPWISELTKAMYENWARLSDLRYIFITEVENADTVACVQKICDIQGLEYPQEYGDKRKWPKKVWRPSTPEFNALLGTRLGKVVAYFLLGAYGQGVKRIARIRFFHSGCDGLNLRFDIEDV